MSCPNGRSLVGGPFRGQIHVDSRVGLDGPGFSRNNEQLTKFLSGPDPGRSRASPDSIAKQNSPEPSISPGRIIFYGMAIILIFQEMAGISFPFGFSAAPGMIDYPDQGDRLDDGAKDFTEVNQFLRDAAPVSWQGDAAEVYKAANETLVEQAKNMISLDQKMRHIVKKQADFVARTQLLLGVELDALIIAYLCVSYLECWGPASASWFCALCIAVAAVSLSVTIGIVLLWLCCDKAEDTAKDANAINYDELTAAAQRVIDAYQHAAFIGDKPWPQERSGASFAHYQRDVVAEKSASGHGGDCAEPIPAACSRELITPREQAASSMAALRSPPGGGLANRRVWRITSDRGAGAGVGVDEAVEPAIADAERVPVGVTAELVPSARSTARGS